MKHIIRHHFKRTSPIKQKHEPLTLENLAELWASVFNCQKIEVNKRLR